CLSRLPHSPQLTHCRHTPPTPLSSFFSFTDPPPPELYTLSLHDALPISYDAITSDRCYQDGRSPAEAVRILYKNRGQQFDADIRSEEHTSELQSRENLVCRLLLEKKKKQMHLAPLTRQTECDDPTRASES